MFTKHLPHSCVSLNVIYVKCKRTWTASLKSNKIVNITLGFEYAITSNARNIKGILEKSYKSRETFFTTPYFVLRYEQLVLLRGWVLVYLYTRHRVFIACAAALHVQSDMGGWPGTHRHCGRLAGTGGKGQHHRQGDWPLLTCVDTLSGKFWCRIAPVTIVYSTSTCFFM